MKTITVTGKNTSKELCELDLTEALKRCDQVHAALVGVNRTAKSAVIADLGRFSKDEIRDLLRQVRS